MSSVVVWLSVFFFSSRRRHTRYWRDWSSDVVLFRSTPGRQAIKFMIACRPGVVSPTVFVQQINTVSALTGGRVHINIVRSEERRVGKECRSRRSQNHEKKKAKNM